MPYWLFDCKADFDYHATGENHLIWSDGDYDYTQTDLFHIHRAGTMDFENIPLDASENMEDALMDALEPFDFTKVEPFDMRYLSGYLAEKYTYEEGRRYDVVHSVQCNTNYKSDHQAYLLLPVWMLVSNFKGKKYLFAMNGQTGKIVGELPCDTGRSVTWFLLIFVIVFVVAFLLVWLIGGVMA